MKTLPLITLIAVAALSACGGGGNPTSTANTATLTGKVMDGYVQGAKVCLDLNKNDVCDSGEPTATTGQDGSYSLTYPASSVLAETPVLVSIGVGAVDSTNGTVTQPYAMRSMGDSAGVISPFTTLTFYEMKFNPGKTFNDWSKVISQRLLGSSTAIDVKSDYLEAKRPDLLNTARALVASMQIAWGNAAPTIEQFQSFNTTAPTLAAWAFANPAATYDQIKLKAVQYTAHDYTVSTLPISLGNTTPSSIAVDGSGNVYFTTSTDVMMVAGGSGSPKSIFSMLGQVTAVAADNSGNVFALIGNMIMKVSNGSGELLAGYVSAGKADGIGAQASFNAPQALAVGDDGKIYVADSGNSLVRVVDPATGAVSTFMSGGAPLMVPNMTSITEGFNGTVYTISSNGIQSFTSKGLGLTYKGTGVEQALPGWSSLATNGNGVVFVTDVLRNKIWRIMDSPDTANNVSLAAGTGQSGKKDGLGSIATLSMPYSLAIDKGGVVYINDMANRAIRVMR